MKINEKVILTGLSLIGLSGALYMFAYTPLVSNIESSKIELEKLKNLPNDKSGLSNKLTQLNIENDTLDGELREATKANNSKTKPSKEAFLSDIVIGLLENSVDLVYFYDISYETSSVKNRFTFDIRGTISNINAFTTYLDKLNIKYSVGGFSLRQDNDTVKYLERDFDGISKLSWFDLLNNTDNTEVDTNKSSTEKENKGGLVYLDENGKPQVNKQEPVSNTVDDNYSEAEIETDVDIPTSTVVGLEDTNKSGVYDSEKGSITDRLNSLINLDNLDKDVEVEPKPEPEIKPEPKPEPDKDKEVIEEEVKKEEIKIEDILYKLTIVLEY